MITLPEIPFALTPSHPDAWQREESTKSLIVDAIAHSDFYINPGGTQVGDAESQNNAATLLGTPDKGDFQFSARITVDFHALFDAGVLFLWADEKHWAKFCLEFSPASQAMVVSVVTQERSDDSNAYVIAGRSMWYRMSRRDHVYAFHASTDGKHWELIRVFSLGTDVTNHKIGFEAQSPTGDGCRVTFEHIHFISERLADLRDGS